MKAQELRVGNWVYACKDGIETKVLKIMLGEQGTHDLYEPIPLTAQWLKDLGLEDRTMMFENVEMVRFRKDEFLVEYDINGWFCYLENNTEQEITIRLSYVHQAQNLCFALTGKELTK